MGSYESKQTQEEAHAQKSKCVGVKKPVKYILFCQPPVMKCYKESAVYSIDL
jgi:hypothetical protein